MTTGTMVLCLFALMISAPSADAQAGGEVSKNEVGLVIGATVTPSQTLASGTSGSSPALTFKPSLALGAESDHQLNTSERIAFLAGADFLASPRDVKLDQRPANVISQYAYVFLIPHIRVKFHPKGPISPWLLFGGGYARYRESAPPTVTGFKGGTNTGTLEFGGGVDTGTVHRVWKVPVGFRLEVRDFYAGQPNYNLPVSGSFQNNIAFTGGLLIKF